LFEDPIQLWGLQVDQLKPNTTQRADDTLSQLPWVLHLNGSPALSTGNNWHVHLLHRATRWMVSFYHDDPMYRMHVRNRSQRDENGVVKGPMG
jgi:hypothetical protein